MCGITGIINFSTRDVEQSLLISMRDRLIHRGPDDSGLYIDNSGSGNVKAGIAMRRLSIIDLDTGKQPIFNEDKSLSIVFNGEIYNYKDLRAMLEKKHKFSTLSDTEVILHLYEEYREKCLDYLRGMFAFAIWDSAKKEMFIARDRLGQKPLYYCRIDSSFYFASEIKSLLEIPGFKKTVNYSAIHDYLTYQYIHSPATIWEGVHSLEPASYLYIKKNGDMYSEEYWNVSYRSKTEQDYNQSKERLVELLKESTSLRMISDVPLGAFLSGGIDSSIIVALMSELSGRQVQTFSIGFKDEEFSELKYARKIAELYSTDHHEFIVEPEYIDILPKIVWHYDQPYADCSALPSYYVSKMTSKYVKVALNGDAGDENFAGYLRHRALYLSELTSGFTRRIPSGMLNGLINLIPMNESVKAKSMFRYLHRFAEPLKYEPALRNLIWHAYFTNDMKDFIYSDKMKQKTSGSDSYQYLKNLFNSAPASNVIDRSLYADIMAYLPEDLLVKVDVASMANSLEARSPFLDHKLVEYSAGLPPRWKIDAFRSKKILKESFKEYLPRDLINRKKQGFSIPLGRWFREDLKDYLKEILLSPAARRRDYFNFKNLEFLIDEHIRGHKDYGYCLWALLMLEMWHRVFIEQDIT